MKVKRALISVFDKTGIAKFAQALESFGVEINPLSFFID